MFRQIRDFFNEDPEETPLADSISTVAAHPATLLPHLNDLRKGLFRSLLVISLTTAFVFTFSEQAMAILARPLPDGIAGLQAIEVTEPLSVLMRVSLLGGFALALPYIVFEIILFFGPGLKRNTRVLLFLGGVPASTILFLLGMAFAYFVMLPAAIPFLIGIGSFETNLRPASYFKFVTGVLFWIGLIFQLPLVVYVVARLGWITARALAHQWRLAMVAIAVLAAAITPTVDPVSMSLMMAPLILLYFLSIGLAYLAEKARLNRPESQAEPADTR